MGRVGSDPRIEACILTREVQKGGQMVNEARGKNGLKPVDLVFVDMILAQTELDQANYSNKISSTNIRQYLASQQQK